MNHVFILGAGASKAAANAPLGAELVWGPGALSIPKEDHRRFVELCLELWPELQPLVEELDYPAMFTPYGTVAAIARETGKKYCVDELLEHLVKERRDDDVEFIREAIYRHIAGAIEPRTEAPMYQFFVRHLHQLRSRASVSVISFNYDHLLHEDFELPFYVNFDVKFDEVCSCRDYQPERGVLLLKPNGSFDWLDCPNCGRMSLAFHQCWGVVYHNVCPACGFAKARRCIMLPHEDKPSRYGHLWHRIAKVLRGADEITIIGYSFPDYDVRMKNVFRENVPENAQINVVDWAVPKDWSRCAETIIHRYQDVLLRGKKCGLSVRCDGFEGFLKSLG